MTHQQVIELVEKWLTDNDSVTTDELKRAYDTAYELDAALENAAAAANAANAANANAYTAAAAAANAAKHVKRYHDQIAEQAK